MKTGRRQFLQGSLLSGLAVGVAPSMEAEFTEDRDGAARSFPEVPAFELEEITIAELQEGMKSGKYTARAIAEKYLARIDALDKHGPSVNSVIEVNPDALEIAEACDKERKAKGARGPLHGIPVLIKDNIDTADKMMTTAGSLALVGSKVPKDSVVAQKLREAGAVIIGKTNLSEWANIRSRHSSSGWSGRGGQTKNPYALDRNPCGSSSGSGAAASANFCAAAVGTETDGSIVCPSSANGLVGIKPTVGLVSRSGIVPISHTQDGAGPMCRTVRDAATVLGALTGVDADDSATADSRGKSLTDCTQFLRADGLRGARIGVVRKAFGFMDAVDKVMEAALEVLKKEGATLVDPAEIETAGKWSETETLVFTYELKADLNAYLARPGFSAPVKTLKDIIEFNEKNREKEMPYFGQDFFLKTQLWRSTILTRWSGQQEALHGSPTGSMAITSGAAAREPLPWPAIPISPCRRDSFSACPWAFPSSDAPGASRCSSGWPTHLSRPQGSASRRSSCRVPFSTSEGEGSSLRTLSAFASQRYLYLSRIAKPTACNGREVATAGLRKFG